VAAGAVLSFLTTDATVNVTAEERISTACAAGEISIIDTGKQYC